jgi:hypothetical protein
MHSSSVAGREIFVSQNSGRITASLHRKRLAHDSFGRVSCDVEPVSKPDFVIRDLRQLHLGGRGEIPTIERGSALRVKYLPVRPEITQTMQSFVAANMAGRNVLGVHFRGTDKNVGGTQGRSGSH